MSVTGVGIYRSHSIGGFIHQSGLADVCFVHGESVSVVQLQRKAEL